MIFCEKYRMNHPSEWTRFYDRGRYRYRHKGTGVVRDTLMAIGRQFAKIGKQKAKKTAEKAAEKATETAKQVAERGADKIQQVLKRKKIFLLNQEKCLMPC